MINRDSLTEYGALFRWLPDAQAVLRGSENYPGIHGRVMFYKLADGVMVRAEVEGLPADNEPCHDRIFAFHIHEGSDCGGTMADHFSAVGGHFNPAGCLHPYHAGDMPPLFGVNGRAFLAFLTDRFTVREIIGRTVIIHGSPDDFTTQPSGNAGEMIACGEITAVRRR